MTRLFESSQSSIKATVSFSDILLQEEVVVADDIWQSLLFILDEKKTVTSGRDRIAVSLAFHGLKLRDDQCSPIFRIVWAVSPQASSYTPLPGSVVVSRQSNHCIPLQAGISFCTVSVVTPAQLTEIATIVSSSQSLTTGELEGIKELLCNSARLFRTGSVLCFGSAGRLVEGLDNVPDQSWRLDIAMTLPVSQGFCFPGKTRFLLALKDSTSRPIQPVLPCKKDSVRSISADDDFTIDENFFANSILDSVGHAILTSSTRTGRQDDHTSIKTDSFSVEPLLSSSSNREMDSYMMYVSTEDLGKLGVFSGDWCMATFVTGDSRLVQVNGLESSSRQRVYASSQLLYNCGFIGPGCNSLSINASPFGTGPPTIPAAQTVTLARITSPLSLDKAYYSAMLRSLKKKLETSRSLIKRGDVISVNICPDCSLELVDCDEDGSGEDDSDEVLQKSIIPVESHLCDNVHFVVSSVENNAVRFTDPDSGLDAFSRSASGELGCWIDSTSTRVIQTGLEHRLVPSEHHDTSPKFDINSFKTYFDKLYDLTLAALEENAAAFGLELTVLLKGPAGPVMVAVVEAVANRLGFHVLQRNAFDISGETEAKTEARLKEDFDVALSCSPCVFLLRDIDGLLQVTQAEVGREQSIARSFQECTDKLAMNWRQTGFPVLVIATTKNADRVSLPMLSCFKHELDFEVPNESSRLASLTSLLFANSLAADVSLKELSVQTAAFTDSDLLDVVSLMRLSATERTLENTFRKSYEDILAIHDGGVMLNADDFETAIGKARLSFSQNIGAPSIPKVSWEDVGGLAKIKQDILDTIQLPLDNPSLFADGLKQRSGILLYGPPGTGKTLVAKAVATSCSLNFFSVKGPELLNMYIGESEANVRRVFQQAREAKPCAIFFDELDSIAPKRGNHGDSGGVMDRIVSQLLAELDGMSSPKSGADVFVIGATNRPDLLDPALLRPGRFDRLLYLGVSDTHEAQLSILEALTRKFRLDPNLDLMDVAVQCPFNYTGADFYALCSDAMLKAMARKAQSVEAILARMNKEPRIPNQHYPITPQYYLSELASPPEIEVTVTSRDFEDALRGLVPSVSQAEMEHYREIQKRFSEGSVSNM